MTCGGLICLGLSKLVRRLGPRPRPLPWAPVNEVPHHRAFRLAHVPRGAEDSPRKLHGAVIAGGEQLISERGAFYVATSCRELRELRLCGCVQLQDEEALQATHGCSRLEVLELPSGKMADLLEHGSAWW